MRAILLVALAARLLTAAPNPVPRFTDPARREKLARAFPQIDEIFRKYQTDRNIPGLIYGIVIDGELAHVKAFGVSDHSKRTPVTADTVFRIASMTKSFTALAILKLRDEGKLSLEDPVSKWIPEFSRFEKATADTAPIRVRQLLTHGSGFPEDNPWGDRQLAIDNAKLTKWLEEGVPFSTPPDTAYEYSNYGFGLLGRIVTTASGVPYSRYLKEQILTPLGMTVSTLEPSFAPEAMRAVGYGPKLVIEESLPDGAFGPMGGLLVSARDLAKYVAYQLAAWPPRDDEEKGPVRRSSQREMQQGWRKSVFFANRNSPDAPLRVTSSAYGYGLGVTQDCRFGEMVSHGGGLPGFGSHMSWLPEYGVGVIAMTNLTYAGPSAAVSDAYDALLQTGGLQPRKLPASDHLTRAREGIVRLWQKWDPKEAERLMADNFFLDRSAEERQKDIEALKRDLGACKPVGAIEPENWLRGKFRMSCDRGFVDAVLTLAPTKPPTVQYLRFNLRIHSNGEGEAGGSGYRGASCIVLA